MSDTNYVIEVNDLVKRYGDFTAVNGISFNVKQGEIFGLLGPNGAGKTTTLEIIETLRPKTSGNVKVLGYDIEKQPDEIKKRIGVQLQSAGYYPSLTLNALVDLFSGLYNTPVNSSELLKRVGLLDKAKAKYKTLSGGQKQRFSICTTLIHKPQIVFLDEPTTGLDPQARRNLWELIREIKSQGTTVVITTHYMDEAENLCERVGIMEKGQIVAISTPHQLIDELVESGNAPTREVKRANLEDVFLHLTGREWRDE
jgi:ABC-2 type transport system ATP-binding protein